MLYYLVAALLLAHAVFWGAGLALLSLPRHWRPVWWIFAAPFGWALQSAVVWVLAHGPWRGTDAYAWPTEVLPAILLAIAVVRRGIPVPRGLGMGSAAIVLAGALLLWPLSQRGGWTLTSASLGSCDHADYAAGARVLKEFARGDRSGFLDLPEVTKVAHVDRFFDYWLHLNHFSPAAIIAHNGSVFGFEPYQLISVTAAVFWLAGLPMVLLVARLAGWRRSRRGAALLLFAMSPIGAYGVHQAALGQLVAVQAIALLTLALESGGRSSSQSFLSRFPVVFVAIWLLAGSYNFILVIAAVPAFAGLVFASGAARSWRPPVQAGALALGALLICVVFAPGRFSGLAARFRLLEEYDFGWQVPLLTPEGWLGAVRDASLAPWDGWRLPLLVLLLGLFLAGLRLLPRLAAWRIAGWLLAVMGGWALLAWESRMRPNASYDAYKVTALFLPLLLPAFLSWFGVTRARWTWVVLAGLFACAGYGAAALAARMIHPPLRVDRTLVDLQRIEELPQVESVNLRVERFWSRLWANAFLLREPQYFPTHTYEGRLNTALRGTWDLYDDALRSLPADSADAVKLNHRFFLVRAGVRDLIEARWGNGWHAAEDDGGMTWRWAADGTATIDLHNPSARPAVVAFSFLVRSTADRKLVVCVGEREVARAPVHRDWAKIEVGAISLGPGLNQLRMETVEGSSRGGESDARLLSFALREFVLQALPAADRFRPGSD